MYQRLLRHPNNDVRKYATDLFIGAAHDRDIHLWASELNKRLNLETNPAIRMVMIRSLGHAISVGQFSIEEVSTYRETLNRLMNAEGDLYDLSQMDLGLMRLPEGKIDLLIFERFLKRVEQFENFSHPLLSKIVIAASLVLGSIDNPEASLLFVELLKTFKTQDNISRISKDLIDKAFIRGGKPDLNNLEAHQKLAIKTILSKVVDWRDIGDYLWNYGLPTSRQTLAQIVNADAWPF